MSIRFSIIAILMSFVMSHLSADDLSQDDKRALQKSVSEEIIYVHQQKVDKLKKTSALVPDPAGNGQGPAMKHTQIIAKHQKILKDMEATDFRVLAIIDGLDAKISANDDLTQISEDENSIKTYEDLFVQHPEMKDKFGAKVQKLKDNVARKPDVEALLAKIKAAKL